MNRITTTIMLAAMIYCVTYVGGVSAIGKNATTPPISTETPDGTTPSKELCNTALMTHQVMVGIIKSHCG